MTLLKRRHAAVLFLSSTLLMISSSLLAGQPDELLRGTERLARYDEHCSMKEESLFAPLRWQFLGPTNISGRITDVAVTSPRGKTYTIYAAGASGGVWKTVNEGITWQPVFESAASTSIGDVTIAPSNQEIVWIGTGEANIFRSSMAGSGVYKSIDAGNTWKQMGLADTHTIPRIVIHPENPDIVYVAASGHEWTNNRQRGVYKTTNGGEDWAKVFHIDSGTGAIDLLIDPADPDTLYAATWQRIRKKWNDPRNETSYSGSAIYRTENGGERWKKITNGLPSDEHRGRIGIDIARSNPRVLYAFIDNYEYAHEAEKGDKDAYGRQKGGMIKGATVYRTDDRGESWKQVSESNRYMERLSATYGWVFGQIRVDPNNEDKIYVMGISLNVSEDGGKTFRRLGGMHGDHHGLWIDPDNSDYLVNANDGGLVVSYDGGKNWRNFNDKLPLVQFYNVSFDMDEPFHVYGSIQDHGSRRGIVDLSRGRHRIPAVEWTSAPGGEGSSHAIDPSDPNIVYSAGFYGSLTRTDLRTDKRTRVVPRAAKGEPPLRCQWVAPFIISPHNPRVVYHGSNFLHRSMHRGDSWERISPDLTGNDPDKQGDIPYQTIFAIAESPLRFGLIYAGTDDGKVHVTADSGTHWTDVTDGLAPGRWISRIAASAFDAGTVYVAQNGKRDDDFAVYLWKSTDCGATWHDISGNIPCGPVNVIREDPENREILYAGTDIGVYVSINTGESWHCLGNGLPSTFVHDLAIHPRDRILVAATHGRGMYAMDVEYLQKFNREIVKHEIFLFETGSVKPPRGRWGRREQARIHYYLKEPREVVFSIVGPSGKEIKEITDQGRAGLNIALWDLSVEREEEEGEKKPGGRRYAEPGKYTLRVKS